jgi:hypothetical protein
LYVGFTEDELEGWGEEGDGTELDDFVCAVPFTPSAQRPSWAAPDPEWWFMWWGDQTMPICEATDMSRAARVIADQLFEESA